MKEETAGSLLAKVLRARDEGVSEAEIASLQKKFQSRAIEQLSDPNTRATLSSNLIERCLRSDIED